MQESILQEVIVIVILEMYFERVFVGWDHPWCVWNIKNQSVSSEQDLIEKGRFDEGTNMCVNSIIILCIM
jgi:hypothetical protein